MLADTIQLEAYTATPVNALLLTRYAEQMNRSDYIVSGHTTSSRKQFQVYRTFPKRNGDSLGVRKCAVKFTWDREVENAVGDTVLMPLIVELSYSIPQGVTDEDISTANVQYRGILVSGTNLLTKLTSNLEI